MEIVDHHSRAAAQELRRSEGLMLSTVPPAKVALLVCINRFLSSAGCRSAVHGLLVEPLVQSVDARYEVVRSSKGAQPLYCNWL